MLVESKGTLEVLEAELADVDLVEGGVVCRVRGRVPGVHLMPAKLDHLQAIVGNIGRIPLF